MATDEWIEFGQSELINLSRTVQLAEALGIDSVWTEAEKVAWVQAALGGVDYDDITEAPWYDPAYPASAEFAGLVPLSFTGLDDSTRESSTIEYITNGGSAGRARNKTLPMVANVVVAASTPRGAEFGKRWLDRLLTGGGARDFCSGSQLRVFRYEPVNGEGAPPQVHWRDVTLSRGTSVTRKRNSDCASLWFVTFTLTANDPFQYGDPEPQFSDLGLVMTNRITNYGFETNTNGWTASGGALTRSTSEHHSGVASGAWATTSSVNDLLSQVVPIYSERTFSGSAWVKGPVGASLLMALQRVSDSFNFAEHEVTLTGAWQRITLSGTAPFESTQARIVFTSVASGTYYIDDVVLVNGLVPADLADLGNSRAHGAQVASTGSLTMVESGCPVYDYTPIYDPAYPALVPPPAMPDFYPTGWDLEDGQTFTRYWARLNPIEPHSLDFVPVLTLRTDVAARMVRVSIWDSEAGTDAICDPLWTAIITYVPPGLDFTIDGEESVSFAWDGASPNVRRTDSLVFGTDAKPINWSAFNDPQGLLVTLDLMTTAEVPSGDATLRASLAMVSKSD